MARQKAGKDPEKSRSEALLVAATHIRPLLATLGQAVGDETLIAGLCLSLPSQSDHFLFAERAPKPLTDLPNRGNCLPSTEPFVQAVVGSSDGPSPTRFLPEVVRFSVGTNDHEDLVLSPLKEVFGDAKSFKLVRLPLVTKVEAEGASHLYLVMADNTRSKFVSMMDAATAAVHQPLVLVARYACRRALFQAALFAPRQADAKFLRELRLAIPPIDRVYEDNSETATHLANLGAGPRANQVFLAPEHEIKLTFHEDAKLSADEQTWLKRIDIAKELYVEKRIAGSFVTESVFLCHVTPKSTGSAKAYPVIAKIADLEKLQEEREGLRSLTQYYKFVGHMLAPPALDIWPIEPRRDDDKRSIPRALVLIPELEVTGTLRGLLSTKWWREPSSTERRRFFGQVCRQAVEDFLHVLCDPAHTADAHDHSPWGVLETFYLGSGSEAVRRRKKTTKLLRELLGGRAEQIAFQSPFSVSIVNPWVLFRDKVAEISVGEDSARILRCRQYSWTHGDFHAGNLMVLDSPRPRLFVLDYDYVDIDCMFVDVATLEASIVLGVAEGLNSDNPHDRERLSQILRGVDYYSSTPYWSVGGIRAALPGCPEAIDLGNVLQHCRSEVTGETWPLYRAQLTAALLRLITSSGRDALKQRAERRDLKPGEVISGTQKSCLVVLVYYVGRLLSGLLDTSALAAPEVLEHPLEMFAPTGV